MPLYRASSSVASASETAEGIIEIATQTETETGTDTGRAVVPGNLIPADLTWTGHIRTQRPFWGIIPFQYGGWSANNDGSLGYDDYGLMSDTNNSATGATSVVTGNDNAGYYRGADNNTASANSACGMRSDQAVTAIAKLPECIIKFFMPRTTNIRYFVGLSETALTPCQADDPAEDYIGLQFSTNRADTNFQFIHEDTAQTTVDSGVTADTNVHYLHIRADTTSSVVLTLYDSTFTQEATTTVTTQIPSNALIMQVCCEQLNTTDTGYRVYNMFLINKGA